MKRLSSRSTALTKRICPLMWFGTLILFAISAALGEGASLRSVALFYPVIAAMALGGYFVMKKLLFDLIDEVWDEGSSLLFRNRGHEVRVALKDVKNISYANVSSPPRVTISVRQETALGSELSFTPPTSLMPFKRSPAIDALIERVDDHRGMR